MGNVYADGCPDDHAATDLEAAAGGATAIVVTDPHWCREQRYYRYDLEWHHHRCGHW